MALTKARPKWVALAAALALVGAVVATYVPGAWVGAQDPSEYHKISIEKTVDFDGDGVYSDLEVGSSGSPALWKIVVTNASVQGLIGNVTVTDTNGQAFGPFDLNKPGDFVTFIYTTYPTMDTINTATALGTDPLENPVGPVSDDAAVQIMVAGEGCTPGFWKNNMAAWAATGYSPGDDFDSTFGVDLFNPDIGLEQAVKAKGGGINKLARHGTAALLNAAHPDVAYPLRVVQVIAAVQAGDVDNLVGYNELLSPICD